MEMQTVKLNDDLFVLEDDYYFCNVDTQNAKVLVCMVTDELDVLQPKYMSQTLKDHFLNKSDGLPEIDSDKVTHYKETDNYAIGSESHIAYNNTGQFSLTMFTVNKELFKEGIQYVTVDSQSCVGPVVVLKFDVGKYLEKYHPSDFSMIQSFLPNFTQKVNCSYCHDKWYTNEFVDKY